MLIYEKLSDRVSTDNNVMILGSLRQVQNIIKLEPSIDCLPVHFVMLNLFQMVIPFLFERKARDKEQLET